MKKTTEAVPQNQLDYSTANIILARLRKGIAKREELRALTGLTDRKVRGIIHELQEQGHLIVNLSDGRGYKIASSKEELERYKAQEWSRVSKSVAKLNAMQWGKDNQVMFDV